MEKYAFLLFAAVTIIAVTGLLTEESITGDIFGMSRRSPPRYYPQDCIAKCEENGVRTYKECVDAGTPEADCQRIDTLVKDNCNKACFMGKA